MRGYPLATGAFALMIGAAGLVPTVTGASPVAAVTSATTLHVAPCATTGDGSAAEPFCTLAQAAAAVQPGGTVLVKPGIYTQTLNVTRSGTAGAPITF